jgi:DNA-binding CsgD family transcriptional regulator
MEKTGRGTSRTAARNLRAVGEKAGRVDRDVASALAILDDIYAAAVDDRWARPVEALAEAFRARCGVLFAQNIETHEVPMLEYTRIAPEALGSYVSHYAAINPWIEAERDMPAGTAVTSEQLVDDESFIKSAFYNEWLAPQGLRHALGSVILRKNRTLFKMTLVRPHSYGPYDAGDLDVFCGFCRHFARALELREHLSDMRWRDGVHKELLEGLSVGAALLGGNGSVMFANRRLRELVAAGDGLDIDENQLRPSDPRARRRFERFVGSGLRTGAGTGSQEGGDVAIPRPSMRRALVASIIPLPETAANWFDERRPPVTAVFVSDPEAPPLPDSEQLADLYGLTPAEARLAIRVAGGSNLQDTARQLGITSETARNVIKRIFWKTDTHSQAQLVQLLLSSCGRGQFDGRF